MRVCTESTERKELVVTGSPFMQTFAEWQRKNWGQKKKEKGRRDRGKKASTSTDSRVSGRWGGVWGEGWNVDRSGRPKGGIHGTGNLGNGNGGGETNSPSEKGAPGFSLCVEKFKRTTTSNHGRGNGAEKKSEGCGEKGVIKEISTLRWEKRALASPLLTQQRGTGEVQRNGGKTGAREKRREKKGK